MDKQRLIPISLERGSHWFHSPEIKKLNLNEVYVSEYGWVDLKEAFNLYCLDITSYINFFMKHKSKKEAIFGIQKTLNNIIGDDTCYFLSHDNSLRLTQNVVRNKNYILHVEYNCSIEGAFLKHVKDETRMVKDILT